MAPKTTLNEGNLKDLGPDRLAQLVMDLVKGNAALKRQARAALLEEAGAAHLGAEIRKRIATLRRSRSFVDWRKQKALVSDLDRLRVTIADKITRDDPKLALDLTWRFLELAAPTYERCDDSSGRIGDVFRVARDGLSDLLPAAEPDPIALAGQIFTCAIEGNDYGQYDGLIGLAGEALGSSGRDRLQELIETAQTETGSRPKEQDGEVIGWGPAGALHLDRFAFDHRQLALQAACRDLADAQGDVDTFIATFSQQERKAIWGATAIAARLADQGRSDEAWDILEAAESQPAHMLPRLIEAKIVVLESAGRGTEAQAMRRRAFEDHLDAGHLRRYLAALPDFEDMEAEERALTYVAETGDKHTALQFLIQWPALERAGALVRAAPYTWNGDLYELLRPAAEALDACDPVASTILRRAMIEFTLETARSKRYRHAARHLAECQSLANSLAKQSSVPSHKDYLQRLKTKHGRKTGFWALVE